ncbi:MAG: glycosyltransferase family 4 protein [Deltaproteobacteria bacterium]|nr:glycosyltransferase family 4 protein [Deltaproteobacteria bacterium]
MHIAQIAPPWIPVPPPTYGGTELMVALLSRGLLGCGQEVQLFCSGDSLFPLPHHGPYPEAFWPPDKFSENLHLSYAWAHLRSEPPQVIHSHLENAAGFWAAGPPPAPLAITLHTPLTPVKQDYLLHFPQVHLVAVSNFQYRQLLGHPRRHLIPHGLDVGDYPFEAQKQDFLLFLGRIYPDKGLHTAIRLTQEIGVRLVIAGPVFGPDQPYFDQEIRPRVDGEQIIYLGPANFTQKVALLGQARGLVLPLEVDEAFGLVLLEAMACGTPVLAYDRGAVSEVVAHGETGFVVRTYGELRDGCRRLAELDPFRCREHVSQKFSLEQMVEAYLSLYEQMQ